MNFILRYKGVFIVLLVFIAGVFYAVDVFFLGGKGTGINSSAQTAANKPSLDASDTSDGTKLSNGIAIVRPPAPAQNPRSRLNEKPPSALPPTSSVVGTDSVTGTVTRKMSMSPIASPAEGSRGGLAGSLVSAGRDIAGTYTNFSAANPFFAPGKGGNDRIKYSFTISQGDDMADDPAILVAKPNAQTESRKQQGDRNVSSSQTCLSTDGRVIVQTVGRPTTDVERVLEEDIPFAPYGRLVRCELLNAIESFSPTTPVIARVLEPVYFRGHLIIPAGSEVHGTAQTGFFHKRVITGREWRIILPMLGDKPAGTELRIFGMALNRDVNSTETRFSPEDGTSGIEGDVIESLNFEEIKLFVATFLSAYAQGMQNYHAVGYSGSVAADATPKNATLDGASKVLNKYAERILEEIERTGAYVRVNAGKTFYLYVQQTLTPSVADIPLPPEIKANREIILHETKRDAEIEAVRGKGSNPIEGLLNFQQQMQNRMQAEHGSSEQPIPATPTVTPKR